MKDPMIDDIVTNNIKQPNTIAIIVPKDFSNLFSFLLNNKYTVKDM